MRTVEVVAAIIKRGDTVFAAQRGFGELAGGWEFPGGKIEPGETPRQALAREIREELDIDVKVGESVCVGEHQREYTLFRMECFMCELEGEEPHLSEHSDAKWVGRDDIRELDWLPADSAGVDAILERGII